MTVKRYDADGCDGTQYVSSADYDNLQSRFQKYCKHDGGVVYAKNHCAICGWDLNKCQHRGENGKFCSQCGTNL